MRLLLQTQKIENHTGWKDWDESLIANGKVKISISKSFNLWLIVKQRKDGNKIKIELRLEPRTFTN